MPFSRTILLPFATAICWITMTGAACAQVPLFRLISPGESGESAKPQPGTPMQEGSTEIGLHIVVLQGEDGVNIVKKKTAVKPVVEVRDRNNLPVAGASVTFTAPGHGASALFINGSRSITLVTDSTGRAAILGMKPVSTGAFKLAVSASLHGQIATATIAQTNVLTAATAAGAGGAAGGAGGAAAGGAATGAGVGAGLSTGVIAAIVGGVAAVAAGAAVAVTHGGGSKPPSSISLGVGSGTPVVGAPH